MSDRVEEAINFAARKLGIEKLKCHQVAALRQFAQGNDLLINLPTGFGKSVIFQASTFVVDFLKDVDGNRPRPSHAINKALVIVVLPLKALAVDQLDRACKLGLEAANITSDIPVHVLEQVRNLICQSRNSLHNYWEGALAVGQKQMLWTVC